MPALSERSESKGAVRVSDFAPARARAPAVRPASRRAEPAQPTPQDKTSDLPAPEASEDIKREIQQEALRFERMRARLAGVAA